MNESPLKPIKIDPTPEPAANLASRETIASTTSPKVQPDPTKSDKPVESEVVKTAADEKKPADVDPTSDSKKSPIEDTPAAKTDTASADTSPNKEPAAKPDTKDAGPGNAANGDPARKVLTSEREAGTKTSLFPPVIITIPPPPQQRRQFPSNPVAVPPCKLTTSEETVTLRSDGSDLAVIVGRDDDKDMSGIKATSSSPQDIAVRREQIEGVKARALYVVHSVSAKAGVYQVTFELPCGKKDLVVKVL